MIKKQLFISNLCWKKKDIEFVIDCIKREHINGIDFAPLNYFNTWKNISKNSKKLSSTFKKKKIKINALQGIFFKKNLIVRSENSFSIIGPPIFLINISLIFLELFFLSLIIKDMI